MSVDPLRDTLTIERIVAVDPPREYRLDPRDRSVAFTAEVGGARQVHLRPLRGGPVVQLTAGEHGASDPQWSPDGRRLAFVRDDSIWVVDVDGSREIRVSGKGGVDSIPRWSPDGGTIAFVSRRRGWSQIWTVEAPVPRRGRPRKEPKPALPRVVTPAGTDVADYAWSPDGRSFVLVTDAGEPGSRQGLAIATLDGAVTRLRADAGAWECGATFLPDGTLLFVSDATGWFQVVHATADGTERTLLTAGDREHGDPGGNWGLVPLASPDGRDIVHVEIHDGLCDLVVSPLAGGPAKRPRGRPPKNPRPADAALPSRRIDPWPGVWRAAGWTSDGTSVLALGESETAPQDLWLLPVPGRAPEGAKPRQLTDSLPAVLRPAFAAGRAIEVERVRFPARDGLRIEANLRRPSAATGKRGAAKVPTVVHVHGGPTAQFFRSWAPFRHLLVREGFAVLDVDVRGSTGYGRAFREGNIGEWGHGDTHDVVDAARWAAAQPWSDGRFAVYGGSYGGYLVLTALVDEPALWSAGVDLYGDSEIAESYRKGDRPGRLDLLGMMGSPDDPARAELYRRGSPVYRAERIEAPVLLLHGRKDKRVVPAMTERMVEALEIEGKRHEVVWFDDEAHGFVKPANRRAALTKIVEFLNTHLPDEPATAGDR